jgi:ABC-type nitrate/sulfonate/bicarbonate transport system substrate-binding protein
MPHRPVPAVSAVLTLTLIATGCAAQARSESPTLKIGYFQGAVAGPEAVVAANPALASRIKAKIELRPIDSGVAGMAQLRAGAFPVVSGVGNPPFVGAFSSGTDVKVVFAESIDQSGLVVNQAIKSNADLKKIGVLVGSTLDFQLRGWLKAQGLTGRVRIASFASEAAEAAAWKSHKIDSVYISQAFLLELKKHGGRVLTTAADIAKLGYAAVNLLAVSRPYADRNRAVVQQLVCQISRAQTLVKGDQAAAYVRPAARFLGVRPDDAVEATKDYPYLPAAEETGWLKGADGKAASGRLAANFQRTGEFLVTQGRAKTAPTLDRIAAHIDPSFWDRAQAGGCA